MRQTVQVLSASFLISAACVLFDAGPGEAQTTSRRTGTQSPFRQPEDTKKAANRKKGKPKKKVVIKTYPKYVNRRDLYGSAGQGYVPAQPATQGTRGF
ncbi:MAG TPA: hypothetical protein V6D08_03985 [Candidatus Obscuribacterales bacterium]